MVLGRLEQCSRGNAIRRELVRILQQHRKALARLKARRAYERLLAKGKPKKLALAAVMRKLVVLLNRIAKDENFVPVAGGVKRKAK